jgi:hypothetical protein
VERHKILSSLLFGVTEKTQRESDSRHSCLSACPHIPPELNCPFAGNVFMLMNYREKINK